MQFKISSKYNAFTMQCLTIKCKIENTILSRFQMLHFYNIIIIFDNRVQEENAI